MGYNVNFYVIFKKVILVIIKQPKLLFSNWLTLWLTEIWALQIYLIYREKLNP